MLTFEQREGTQSLPGQLKLKELSRAVRARLWALVFQGITEKSDLYIRGNWLPIVRDYYVDRLHEDADRFSQIVSDAVSWLKPILLSKSYASCLGFVEFCLRHSAVPYGFANSVEKILLEGGAAYRLLERETIAPISSAEEAEAVKAAVGELVNSGYSGARSHLHNAAQALTAGRYADAVRESIHAVESVALTLSPSSNTLGPALSALEKQGYIHPAMKSGFSNLYGYTNDEGGIRHALLDDGDPKVTESDALYMFGSCASFAAYLSRSAVGR